MKYRIRREVRADGTSVYFPQFKHFLIWHDFGLFYDDLFAAEIQIEKSRKMHDHKKVVNKEYFYYDSKPFKRTIA